MSTSRFIESLRESPDTVLGSTFARHRDALKRIILHRLDPRLRGRVDPSDVVQDTLLEATRRLGEYVNNPSVPFFRWLCMLAEQETVAAHRWHVKVQKRSVNREERPRNETTGVPQDLQFLVTAGTDPGETVSSKERQERLQHAIQMLDPKAQEIIRLRFLEGRRLAEISEILGISTDAVAKRAMRSLRKLSNLVRDIGFAES